MSFNAFPALNLGTLVALILIISPVWGFLPALALLFATEKVPNPVSANLSPFFNAFITVPVNALMAFSADAFEILASFPMVAINSALQVDLTGQVCADSIGTRIYSGFGGQVDFLRGAAAAKGGVPIVALPATAAGGRLSRIVPTLDVGAGVVTTRADVHWVATEHGAVDLFGRTLAERAELLVSIAAPEFRDELRGAARARSLL